MMGDLKKTDFSLEVKVKSGQGVSFNFDEPAGGLPPIVLLWYASFFFEQFANGKFPEFVKPLQLLQTVALLGGVLRRRTSDENWSFMMSSLVVEAVATFLRVGIKESISATTGWNDFEQGVREHIQRGSPEWLIEFDANLIKRIMSGADPEKARRDLLAEWLEDGRATDGLNKLAAYVVRHGSFPQNGNFVDPPAQKGAAVLMQTLFETPC
jgi:hypothetical protein